MPTNLKTRSLLSAFAVLCRGRRLAARVAKRLRPPKNERAAFYDAVWREAAAALGAEVRPGEGGALEIRLGGSSARVRQNHTPFDDRETLARAGDKLLVYRLLREAGLPIPRHLPFRLGTIEKAAAFLAEASSPCVVKPADGTGAGQGVTTGIRDRAALLRAAAQAAAYCDDLLIEEEVAGANYRLLYLDGVLLDALVRKPPTVTGDGRATLRELLERENARRRAEGWQRAQVPLTIDLDLRSTLARQGLSLDSVPEGGRALQVKTVINDNAGRENAAARELLCAEVVEAGARAARAVGVRLAGVDVITREPGVPLERSGGVVLEVNTTPGYYYHYHKEGGACPVALHLLRRLLGEPPARENEELFDEQTFQLRPQSVCR